MNSGSAYVAPTVKLTPTEVNKQTEIDKLKTKASSETSNLIKILNARFR